MIASVTLFLLYMRIITYTLIIILLCRMLFEKAHPDVFNILLETEMKNLI